MATLQVKRVPDELYQQARERAAAEGISLSEYVLRTLRRDLRLAPLRVWVADVRRNPLPIGDEVDVHAILDEVKDEIEGS